MATPTTETPVTPEQNLQEEEPRTPVLPTACCKRLDFEDLLAPNVDQVHADFSDRAVELHPEGEEAVSEDREATPLKRARTEIIPEADQEGEDKKAE